MRIFDRRHISDAIDRHLVLQPTSASRSRKKLDEAVPPFEHVPPIWELRVGEYRVYYDVNEESLTVFVRAIRRKRSHKTTENVFHEEDDN